MFKSKKAVLLINCFYKEEDGFGNLYNELQFCKNIDVFNFYLFKNNKVIDSITTLVDTILDKKYKEIYLIGHNIGSSITLFLTNKYKEITKIIISNSIINEKKLNFDLTKQQEKEINNINQECINNLDKITCPILIIHTINNKITHVDNSIYIHSKVSSKINYLITMNNDSNNIYTTDEYENIYSRIIDFIMLEHEENIIHLNI